MADTSIYAGTAAFTVAHDFSGFETITVKLGGALGPFEVIRVRVWNGVAWEPVKDYNRDNEPLELKPSGALPQFGQVVLPGDHYQFERPAVGSPPGDIVLTVKTGQPICACA